MSQPWHSSYTGHAAWSTSTRPLPVHTGSGGFLFIPGGKFWGPAVLGPGGWGPGGGFPKCVVYIGSIWLKIQLIYLHIYIRIYILLQFQFTSKWRLSDWIKHLITLSNLQRNYMVLIPRRLKHMIATPFLFITWQTRLAQFSGILENLSWSEALCVAFNETKWWTSLYRLV